MDSACRTLKCIDILHCDPTGKCLQGVAVGPNRIPLVDHGAQSNVVNVQGRQGGMEEEKNMFHTSSS